MFYDKTNPFYRFSGEEMTKLKKPSMEETKPSEKIPFTKLLPLIFVILASLGASFYLYDSAYSIPRDNVRLAQAITALHAESDLIVADTEIIESVDVEDRLVVFYREKQNAHVFGFATLKKGLNQKYRLISTDYRDTGFSSVIQPYVPNDKGLKYYIVGGYEVEGSISSYSLDFVEDNPKSQTGEVKVKFDVPGRQFLNVYKASEVDREVVELQGEDKYLLDEQEVSMFDTNGNNVTDNYLVEGIPRSSFAGGGNVEGIGNIYFLIFFIWGTTYVYIRYVLLNRSFGSTGSISKSLDSTSSKRPMLV